jgi:hypothetical protein
VTSGDTGLHVGGHTIAGHNTLEPHSDLSMNPLTDQHSVLDAVGKYFEKSCRKKLSILAYIAERNTFLLWSIGPQPLRQRL